MAGTRRVVRVAFQQAPFESADDIVLHAALPDEPSPSLVIALAVRRAPKLLQSDENAQKLIRQLVQAIISEPADGLDRRLGLVVAGPQTHVTQLSKLADIAAKQTDAAAFLSPRHHVRQVPCKPSIPTPANCVRLSSTP